MHKRTTGAIGAIASAAGLNLLASAMAQVPPADVFKVSYFDTTLT